MIINPRQISIGLLCVLILGSLAVVGVDLGRGTISTLTHIDIVALIIFIALLGATWRGWAYSSYALVIIVTLLTSMFTNEPYLTQQVSLALLLPSIVALVLTGPAWIFASAGTTIVLVLARAGWQGVYADPFTLIIYVISVSGLILGRLVAVSATRIAEQAWAQAEAAAAALQTANAALEQRVVERTAELQTALVEVEARAAAQSQLLMENERQREMIRDLSVPVLPIGDALLVMPLVGALDSSRLQLMQAQALQHIERERARYLLLDVTGVPVIDHQIGQGLIGVVQAARLLGAQVALVGIRPEVAQTIVGLGLPLDGMRTFASLREGVQQFGRHT